MQLSFSFIIPVYNRPNEIKELLESFLQMEASVEFEIVIIEDGSDITADNVIANFNDKLNISYYQKENTGPGDSRNYGMKKAKGNYFIILDSDCLLPPNYLESVINSLSEDFVDCFGGPDAAEESFSYFQKAINFTMTSFITTGGIRGKKTSVDKFQPRSFNMGLSKKAFEATNGFGNIHPGEDPDLSIRLNKLGFKTKLIPEAFVYHKRRISFKKFFNQVQKFGMTRPILNKWYPDTRKITYWFPTLFVLGLLTAIVLCVFGYCWMLLLYGLYFLLVFIIALTTTNVISALMAIPVLIVQYTGYGWGFLKSTLLLSLCNKRPEQIFPGLFFKA